MLKSKIKHVVVIYQENWSFDALYGSFPGANGLAGLTPGQYAQIDKVTGTPLTELPQPLHGKGVPDPNFPAGLPVQFRGIAFSGYGQVKRVEVSDDGGVKWRDAQLGEDLGPYSFRTWSLAWNPKQPGTYQVAVRATDVKGNVQPDEGVWNGGGFLWNKVERQQLIVGDAA